MTTCFTHVGAGHGLATAFALGGLCAASRMVGNQPEHFGEVAGQTELARLVDPAAQRLAFRNNEGGAPQAPPSS